MTTTVDTAVLEARGLSVGYGSVTVVDDLDLVVERGRISALLGPNGAGKTTTLLGLSGVLPLRGGDVRLAGERVSGPLHKRHAAAWA